MGFQSGQRIGQYIIQDFLARGGMGVVWRARDSKNGRQVAIKVVADECINVSNFQQRFADEASRQSRVTHPNIVPVFAAFRFRENYCMVMELIEGTSLDALLRNSKDHRLEMGLATRIMTELLSALNCAHMQGIWHRDVKPSNILLDRENHAHLADFGIASPWESNGSPAPAWRWNAFVHEPRANPEPLRIDHRTICIAPMHVL
jgi:serine/threonine-protein kinase